MINIKTRTAFIFKRVFLPIIHRKCPDPTQMFVLCGDQTRNLLRNRHIALSIRDIADVEEFKTWEELKYGADGVATSEAE
jgi:hypothetical protein